MKTKRTVFATVLAVLLGLTIILPTNALAVNKGTEHGVVVGANSCQLDWQAKTIMSSALTNDDPEYPGLMVNPDGTPPIGGEELGYTNGGYIQAVSPAFGDPGFLEITHFYNGSAQGKNHSQVWRPVVATDNAIKNAVATFTLPKEAVDLVKAKKAKIVLDTTSVNDRIAKWSPAYGKYKWSALSPNALKDNGDGTVTVNLGTMARGTGTVFEIHVDEIEPGVLDEAHKYVSSIKMTGVSTVGQCKPKVPAPEIPQPKVCQEVYGGQALWSVYEDGVYARNKYYWTKNGLKIGYENGEVNSDSWGADPAAWKAGDTRQYRMYAATKKPLKNVTWVIKAAQGVKFTGFDELLTPGAGQLKTHGYTETIGNEHIFLNEAGTEFTVMIDSMPANSSFSFNASAELTADAREKEVLVVNHVLTGDIPDCVPPAPATFVPTPPATEPATPRATDKPSESPTSAPAPTPSSTPSIKPVVGASPTPSAGTLPHTGSNVVGWSVAALMTLIGGGAALTLARRREDR